jgi:hypothetical protein
MKQLDRRIDSGNKRTTLAGIILCGYMKCKIFSLNKTQVYETEIARNIHKYSPDVFKWICSTMSADIPVLNHFQMRFNLGID